jgi:hypothetical protein
VNPKFRALSAWREGALGASPFSDAPSLPNLLPLLHMEGGWAALQLMFGAFRACPGGWARLQPPEARPRRPFPFAISGGGRRRPDEHEPRVDDIDASPSRSAMSRGGALVVPQSGSAVADAQSVRVVPGLAGVAVGLPFRHRGAGGPETLGFSTAGTRRRRAMSKRPRHTPARKRGKRTGR